MTRKFLIESFFWLHLVVVIPGVGLFFIPISLWQERVAVHFWYFASVFGIELLWSILLYPKLKKIDLICPLTTVMQSLRGYPLQDERNHNHSFIAELLKRMHIRANFQRVNFGMIVLFALVIYQFFNR